MEVCLVLLCLCARLFICALWSPAGKGLTSWLSFVVSNCEFVTFPLVCWARCGTWLYRFLIFATLLTLYHRCFTNPVSSIRMVLLTGSQDVIFKLWWIYIHEDCFCGIPFGSSLLAKVLLNESPVTQACYQRTYTIFNGRTIMLSIRKVSQN